MKKSLLFISALIAGASGFAQSIANGNFETWTNATTPANWSKEWVITGLVNAVKSTTDSVAGYVHASAIQIHSAQVSGPSYAPGVAISGANASTRMNITSPGPGGQTITRTGSIPATTRPLTLSGFAKYTTASGSATHHGTIAVEVYAGADIVGGYASLQFLIDSVATFTNFNIPITYTNTATAVDSIRITLSTTTATETPGAGDTLTVDLLRFLSCTINPAATLAAPSVISDDGAAGLAADGNLTLLPSAAYNHTFTFSVPNPSIGTLTNGLGTFNYTISPLDSVIFGDMTNVIPGLTFTQGTPGGVAYPNSLYCYSISGNIPATDNIAYQMNVVQTPYGIVTVDAFGNPFTTTVPIGNVAGQPVDLTNLAVDSVTIIVGTPIGIADFDVSLGFNVSQNSPNPFDGSTTINFTCAVSGTATFVVTDVLGRQVYDTNINATAGSNTFTYSTDLANGTYFFSLSDGTNTITRTMVVTQ